MVNVYCPYDPAYYMTVKVTQPHEAEIFRQYKGAVLTFTVRWYPRQFPSASAGHSTEDGGSGFTIIPHGKYYIEKTLDTLKVILEMIRQGAITYEKE